MNLINKVSSYTKTTKSVGADKEAKDKYGCTPLNNASNYDNLEVVKYLIFIGANKEAKNKYGCTPLAVAKGQVRDYQFFLYH
ncbi:ankyrin repeat protein, putative [Trichomonas vaginalis G3]|uniref:Ankyrin repeat protein, putative n=1 Tax=Trichomonas vaginalis (strain ATCC PRA-98 / G3) TaxID=412133 RepID=A2FPP1_TRIV3|nr:ankyrin repeat protein family [Trichomonas vaginalis G3]EAX93117.1 ankyrin repeat protein, putative [Trichomonas vaginalis G3]KAI5514078.1 ankyrin repeat protein family [Trichomonas vaginalis G3]|eukprot:XP_001306047.1 ankyrin repeat protein [Trichomonas vaginalis G3]